MTAGDLQARIGGVGLVAPGIADWSQGRLILAGREPWQSQPLLIPATEFLPPAERRRAGKALRLALGCGHQAIVDSGRPAADLASVFASTDVDAENTHQICLALNEAEPNLSPTRFHNSVQNAVSGYWTILTGSRAPTTMVMGGDEILALGLLEAMSQAVASARPVLLVVFDVLMPTPLFATHPIVGGGALALLLEPGPGEGPTLGVRLVREVSLEASRQDDGPVERADALADDVVAGLDALRDVHPIGKALPMLARLARWQPLQESAAIPGPDNARAAGGGSKLKFDRYHSLQVTVD